MYLKFWTIDNRRRDTDNLTKAVKDALNGIVYKDDSQVLAELAWQEKDKADPRTEVYVLRYSAEVIERCAAVLIGAPSFEVSSDPSPERDGPLFDAYDETR